jgi:hypothetical protein
VRSAALCCVCPILLTLSATTHLSEMAHMQITPRLDKAAAPAVRPSAAAEPCYALMFSGHVNRRHAVRGQSQRQ